MTVLPMPIRSPHLAGGGDTAVGDAVPVEVGAVGRAQVLHLPALTALGPAADDGVGPAGPGVLDAQDLVGAPAQGDGLVLRAPAPPEPSSTWRRAPPPADGGGIGPLGQRRPRGDGGGAVGGRLDRSGRWLGGGGTVTPGWLTLIPWSTGARAGAGSAAAGTGGPAGPGRDRALLSARTGTGREPRRTPLTPTIARAPTAKPATMTRRSSTKRGYRTATRPDPAPGPGPPPGPGQDAPPGPARS